MDESSEQELKALTASDSVTVYLQGGDLYIDLFNSKIHSSVERKLFYTVIAKEACNIANNTRSVMSNDSKNVVRFINSGSTDTYEISNRTLLLSDQIYYNSNQIGQSILDGDKHAILEYIDDQLSVAEKNDLINRLFTNLKFDSENTRFNSYGFKVDNEYFNVYMKLVRNNEISFFRFDFDRFTKKLLNFTKISH